MTYNPLYSWLDNAAWDKSEARLEFANIYSLMTAIAALEDASQAAEILAARQGYDSLLAAFRGRGIDVTQYGASGSTTTTTGSVSSGTKSLVVASATGWKVGHGIAIAGAGAAGVELVTSVTSISGTTFTLADNASTTVSAANVYHDDTQAIKDAEDAADDVATATYRPVLIFPACAGYNTTSAITVSRYISMMMNAPIIYRGIANEIALTVGAAGSVNQLSSLVLWVQRSAASTWLSEDSIGIQLINCNTCAGRIVQAKGFTIGLQAIGDGAGFSYNDFFLGDLADNKYSVDLNNNNSGWCNENNWYGGRFWVATGVNSSLTRYGVRVTSKEAYYNNNNVFHKPAFELNASDAGDVAVPIKIEYGSQNTFKDIRNEGNDTTVLVSNASTENKFSTGYGTISITDTSTAPLNQIVSKRYEMATQANNVIFLSGPLHKKACYYDGNTNINVPGVFIADSGDAVAYSKSTSLTLNASYLQCAASRGVGIFVKTSNIKQFVVREDAETGYGGRVVVRCYNSSGTILDNTGGGHPYVKGSAYKTFAYNADFGKAYTTGSDSSQDTFFQVGADVDYVAVFITGGTAVLRIRSFSVTAVNDGTNSSCPATWTGYEEVDPGMNIGTAAPTAGTWAVGRTVVQAVPVVGQPNGWKCTVAGTPGTWVALANL